MAAGRPKKPAALKRVDGTYRKDRDESAAEIEAITSKVEIPKALKEKESQEMWAYLVNRFKDARMLTELDLPMLELMCLEYQRYLNYDVILEEQGHVIISIGSSGNAYQKENPHIKLREQALNRYMDLASKFGMNPSDRSKVVQMGKQEKGDGFDEL